MNRSPAPTDEPPVRPEEVRAELERVRASPGFVNAIRLSRFLSYVVEAYLAGRAGDLKENVIGIDVYGRDADYDPRADAIVRVEAGRLRAKLSEFYENEGRDDALRILLPKGHYVPAFRVRPTPVESSPRTPPVRSSFRPRTLMVAVPILVALIAQLAQSIRASRASDFNKQGWAIVNRPRDDELRLSGRDVLHRQSLADFIPAIHAFERAIALDSNYAVAYAGLGRAYLSASAFDPKLAVKAHAAAQRAMELDSSIPEPYFVIAHLQFFRDWDFLGAERLFRRFLEFAPNEVTARRLHADSLSLTGRLDEAVEEIGRTLDRYPDSPVIRAELCIVLYHLRRYDQVVAEALKIVRVEPGYAIPHWLLGLAYEQMGEYSDALVQFQTCLRLSQGDPRATPAIGHLYGITGKTALALGIIDELNGRSQEEYRAPYSVALVYAGLRNRDSVFEWLDRAYDQHDLSLPYVALDPRFDRWRTDARFLQLLTRLGLINLRPARR